MEKKILVEIIKNNELHADLVLTIQSIGLVVIADSYYYMLDSSLDDRIKMHKDLVMIKILNHWILNIQELKENNTCFLPFDFSDEYIGCLRFELLNGDKVKGCYGITQKILGMMINPSQLECFDIDEIDFEKDSEVFLTSKSELISSIENSINQLKSNQYPHLM